MTYAAPDFLHVETPAMTFIRPLTDRARDVLRGMGQDPSQDAGLWGSEGPAFARWAMASGFSIRFGEFADLDALLPA
jgi:hypothetical protein